MSDLVFGVSGLRGVVGRTLNPDLLFRYGVAFGQLQGEGTYVIGRDTRPSGDMVQAAVTAALTAIGRDVLDIGIAPTPTIQLAVEKASAAGGLCVTASHNPSEWNALKFVGADGKFLDAHGIARLGELARDVGARASWASAAQIGRVRPGRGAIAEHIRAILALDVVDAGAVRAWRPRVVLDCVNGAGAVLTPTLLAELGCDVEPLWCELSGLFERGAEPVPENLTELSSRVRAAGADIGLAHDPDADRLAIVGPDGRPLGEEATLVLAVDAILSRTRGPVVTNLSTTRAVDDVAARHGVSVYRTPVGEANVVSGMRAHGAVIGGEGNGGVIYPALHYGRDAPLAAALILSYVARRGRDLRALVEELPHYTMIKRKIDIPAARGSALDPEALAAALSASFAGGRTNRDDGVRYDLPSGWVHVRPSGTEAVVRIIAEAEDPARAQDLIEVAERALLTGAGGHLGGGSSEHVSSGRAPEGR
jgi:phosphomannomutase